MMRENIYIYFSHDVCSCSPYSEVLFFFHVKTEVSSCLPLFSTCDWNSILQKSRRDYLAMKWKVKFVHFNCLEGLFPVRSQLPDCSNHLILTIDFIVLSILWLKSWKMEMSLGRPFLCFRFSWWLDIEWHSILFPMKL